MVLLFCAFGAAQQGDLDASPELLRAQRQLQQNRSEVDRLLEMRLRHDLGLPVDSDAAEFRVTTPPNSEELDRARRELRELDASTATLLERYNKLKSAADQLHAEAEAAAQAQRREREFVVVPPANAAVPRAGVAASGLPFPPLGDTVPAMPSGEGVVARPTPGDAAALPAATASPIGLDPIRGRIHGSDDHQRVALALFKAGQALMDRAAVSREQQRQDVAREFDTRARERLERAAAEMEPLLATAEPPLASLFLLGRTRELLFRLAQRYDGLSLAASTRDYQQREQAVREPFLKITARDVQKRGERGEVEVLGAWGRAAQSAMEHFRWMNLHAGYDPRAAIDKLTWPGEQRQ